MTMLADLKLYLSITDSAFDSLLTMILEAEKVKADDYLGIKYFDVVVGRTEKFDGNRKIFGLGHANVGSVSVSVIASDDAEEIVDSTTYVIGTERGLVKMRRGELEGGKDSIEITYDGGYGEGAVPKDMEFAVVKQASYEFRRRKDAGLTAVGFPDGTVSKFDTGIWLADVEKILNKYRRITL